MLCRVAVVYYMKMSTLFIFKYSINVITINKCNTNNKKYKHLKISMYLKVKVHNIKRNLLI